LIIEPSFVLKGGLLAAVQPGMPAVGYHKPAIAVGLANDAGNWVDNDAAPRVLRRLGHGLAPVWIDYGGRNGFVGR
jgi:hypothetical protein